MQCWLSAGSFIYTKTISLGEAGVGRLVHPMPAFVNKVFTWNTSTPWHFADDYTPKIMRVSNGNRVCCLQIEGVKYLDLRTCTIAWPFAGSWSRRLIPETQFYLPMSLGRFFSLPALCPNSVIYGSPWVRGGGDYLNGVVRDDLFRGQHLSWM